jgi:hypothetical protein
MTEITVNIDPVSTNVAYRRRGKYGLYLTERAQSYKEAIAWAAKEVGHIHRVPVVEIVFTFADKQIGRAHV